MNVAEAVLCIFQAKVDERKWVLLQFGGRTDFSTSNMSILLEFRRPIAVILRNRVQYRICGTIFLEAAYLVPHGDGVSEMQMISESKKKANRLGRSKGFSSGGSQISSNASESILAEGVWN